MKRKVLSVVLAIILISGLLTQLALAAGTPPTTIAAPENFAAANYGGTSVYCTLSAPDDLRALIDQTEEQRGYGMTILAQVDFKTDKGSWHYSSDWDDMSTYANYTLDYYNSLTGDDHGIFLGHQRLDFDSMFPSETNVPVPSAFDSWSWYKSHSMTLRSRFAINFYNGDIVFSNWSSEYVLSNANKMDYLTILNNNAPTILSAEIVTRGVQNVPWAVVQLAQHPDQVQMLNAASGNSMRTEVWLRKNGDKVFARVGDVPFSNEKINLEVGAYFDGNQTSYGAAGYEVKVRYYMDERDYEQSGKTQYKLLYSAYSNTFSYNMPAWSDASAWATGELQKASDLGLIPDSLKGVDMTKNITREEFAEVALLLYQIATGITDTTPISPNPFTDTTNPKILIGYKLGIVKGISATKFDPKNLINREQVAAMLVRTIKLIAPNADYSTDGAPYFSDQTDISGWALNDCLVIAKLGIIKGSDGKFMPKAITPAQIAAGYANTTREQALIMSLRTVENLK